MVRFKLFRDGFTNGSVNGRLTSLLGLIPYRDAVLFGGGGEFFCVRHLVGGGDTLLRRLVNLIRL